MQSAKASAASEYRINSLDIRDLGIKSRKYLAYFSLH